MNGKVSSILYTVVESSTVPHTTIMLTNEVFQTQLSIIMDTIVELVVREVSRLIDDCFAVVMENEEAQLPKREIQSMNKAKTRTFASFMDVLSKSSIEKIALLSHVVESEVRTVKTATSEVKAVCQAEARIEDNAEKYAAPDFAPLSSPASDVELPLNFDQPDNVNLDPQILSASESYKPDSYPFTCSHCGKGFKIKRHTSSVTQWGKPLHVQFVKESF
ncbi:hypothetical protein UPYG_G00136020 [Umbra pygmaea]|uniref:C2H2-type domain-containing protein n=1 Tax=Umbra pygmaea TaxID=75934 RepID=A0ABD0WYM8_UMBPY